MSAVSALPRRSTFVGPQSEWVCVGPSLWVAVSSGMHQGRVEGHGALFAAIGDVNNLIGEYTTLRDAMTAVETHSITADVAA